MNTLRIAAVAALAFSIAGSALAGSASYNGSTQINGAGCKSGQTDANGILTAMCQIPNNPSNLAAGAKVVTLVGVAPCPGARVSFGIVSTPNGPALACK